MNRGVLGVGHVVGDYDILGELGAGGMGIAYRAFDRRLKRTVALKTFRDATTDALGTPRQLLREARAAAALSHPNICTIYAIDDTSGLPFIVMEYVKGQTLASIVQRGPMEPAQVASLGTQVVDALDAAHRGGVIHRDIKPSNIMLTDDGQVKVLDFGIAAPLAASPNPRQLDTLQGIPGALSGDVGTPAYMSPEQLRGEELDGRTDLFSLGVVLYEACTGRNPFVGPTEVATIARIVTHEPEPVRALLPGFPRPLDDIILRCLAKSRDDRYPSAAALLHELAAGSARPLWRRRDVHALPSLAVLPFAVLGAGDDHTLVADAFVNELTTRLAQVGELLVIARPSADRYKADHQDLATTGRELGVRHVVQGMVRVHGDTCTLSVNLVDVATGVHAWSRTYETQLAHLFDAEADVVQGICRGMQLPAQAADTGARRRVAGRPLVERYQRAVQAYHKFAAADNAVAIDLLRTVTKADPAFAAAHALLASACLARIERGWEPDVSHWMGLAQQACDEALRLDSTLSEAYASRGLIAFYTRRNADAEADAREALRIDPNNDIAHNLLGRVRFARGEFHGAIAACRDALAINPYYVWCLNDLAWALLSTGDEQAGEGALDRELELSPADEGGLCGKAALLHMRGEAAAALAFILRAREGNPSYPFTLQMLPPILARVGQRDAAVQACHAMLQHEGAAYFGHASLGLVQAYNSEAALAENSARRALALVPFHPALNLNYASLYDDAGLAPVARELVRKAVDEGIRLVEVDQWHPTLRRLAHEAGLLSTRSDHD